MPSVRDILNLAEHLSPTSEVLSNRYRHHILRRESATQAQRCGERVTLLGLQVPLCGFESINQWSKKPLRHLVWLSKPLLKIGLIFCDDLILKTADLKHPNSPVLLDNENLTELRE